ncbi:MAG: hypothetical protein ABSB69_13625 [Solirubrobacteraceae bacterium]
MVQLAGTIGMRTNMTGRLQVTHGGMPLDERLAQIEKELQELQAKQQQDHAALHTRIEGMGEEVKETWERLEIERSTG